MTVKTLDPEMEIIEAEIEPKTVVPNDFVPIKEVMEVLGVSRQTIYDWVAAGFFNKYQIGQTVRFRWSEIDRAMRTQKRSEKE